MATNDSSNSSNRADVSTAQSGSRRAEIGDKLSGAVGNARESLSDLGSNASEQIDSSPLIAIGAGAALGAILAAVLPASEREKELLSPLGSKITEAGNGAVDRARDLGKQKFDEMAGDKVREFFGAGNSSNA